jgi:hypothetical protein
MFPSQEMAAGLKILLRSRCKTVRSTAGRGRPGSTRGVNLGVVPGGTRGSTRASSWVTPHLREADAIWIASPVTPLRHCALNRRMRPGDGPVRTRGVTPHGARQFFLFLQQKITQPNTLGVPTCFLVYPSLPVAVDVSGD